jgi:hypothetical protein
MKKVLFLILIIRSLFGQEQEYITFDMLKKKSTEFLNTEIQYAYGKSDLTLSEEKQTISYDVTAYTLVNEHQETSQQRLNYYYETALYRSKTDKKYDAFAFDFGVGYDIVAISKEEYISLSLLTGLYTLNAAVLQTVEGMGFYKLGVRISFAKQLLDSPLFAYGSSNYSMHYTHRGIYDGDGIFNEAKIGVKFKAKHYTRFIFSAGVRYTLISSKDTKLSSSLNYIGVSYNF